VAAEATPPPMPATITDATITDATAAHAANALRFMSLSPALGPPGRRPITTEDEPHL
jgi:hypothetical protein